jgi:large subunit ribosomal protein L7/L12
MAEEEKQEQKEEKAEEIKEEKPEEKSEDKPNEKPKEEKKEPEKSKEEELPTESRGPSTQSVGAKPKLEPKVADKAEERVEVPAKFKKLVDEIEKMSIMDLAELVKILEKKFGVSPMMVAAAPVTGSGPAAAGEAEEKSEFAIELKDGGGQKIQVIKVVREITGKGLKEAKDIVDAAPKVLKENVKKEEAQEIKDKLEKAGATVELK